MAEEGGQVTGTKDKDYNIIWFVEQCLSNALRLQTYIQDAEREGDNELAEFFRRAQGESRKGAEQGKEMRPQTDRLSLSARPAGCGCCSTTERRFSVKLPTPRRGSRAGRKCAKAWLWWRAAKRAAPGIENGHSTKTV